jgi:hypothetical protein
MYKFIVVLWYGKQTVWLNLTLSKVSALDETDRVISRVISDYPRAVEILKKISK